MKKFLILGAIVFGFNLLSASDLVVGNLAPDFTLPDENDSLHTLSDYRGQRVVVYFYPKDDTPRCTKEACGIRDSYGLFDENDIVVLGISYDDAESHQDFILKHGIPFHLLTDTDKSVSKLYGTKGFFFPSRKTFLIDKDGKLIKIYDKVDVVSHARDVLKDFSENK
ncbi:MAG: peroxiredoxin [Candidatus Marinimicrobia bacterium]|nr:peroxiredoxin [Candidatus Neomarinimicrobiota bacterium]